MQIFQVALHLCLFNDTYSSKPMRSVTIVFTLHANNISFALDYIERQGTYNKTFNLSNTITCMDCI